MLVTHAKNDNRAIEYETYLENSLCLQNYKSASATCTHFREAYMMCKMAYFHYNKTEVIT